MFDKDINFLPEELKKEEEKERKKVQAQASPPPAYTPPQKPLEKEQEKIKIQSHATPQAPKVPSRENLVVKPVPAQVIKKKSNYFSGLGNFFSRLFKSKKTPKPQEPLKTLSRVERPKNILAPSPIINIASAPKEVIKTPLAPLSKPAGPAPLPQPKIEVKPPAPVAPKVAAPNIQPPKAPQTIEQKPAANFTSPTLPISNQNKATEVNLIPGDLAISVEFRQKATVFAISVLASFIIIGLAFLGIKYYAAAASANSADIISMKNTIIDIEKQIKVFQEYQVESQKISQEVDVASKLLESHIYWSKFFPALEKITYADARFSSFMGDTTGQITLEVSVPDFYGLAQQIMILKNAKSIEKYEISDIALVEESASQASESDNPEKTKAAVTFNLVLKFKPELFTLESTSN